MAWSVVLNKQRRHSRLITKRSPNKQNWKKMINNLPSPPSMVTNLKRRKKSFVYSHQLTFRTELDWLKMSSIKFRAKSPLSLRLWWMMWFRSDWSTRRRKITNSTLSCWTPKTSFSRTILAKASTKDYQMTHVANNCLRCRKNKRQKLQKLRTNSKI